MRQLDRRPSQISLTNSRWEYLNDNTERLAKAREALAMPAANAQAREDAAAFIKRVAGIEVSCCPHCRLGHWLTIEVLQATSGISGRNDAVPCRGPP
jgi:hypothetical protein